MTGSLRRPLAVAAVLFVLILALLAGRVHAGADPAQVTPSSETVRSATPAPETSPDGEFTPGGQDLDPPVTQAS